MINSKELLSAIDKIKPALSNNKFSDYSGLVIFTGEQIAAYGDEISVYVPFKTDFKTVLPIEELSKLVKKISVKEIEMTLEKDQLVLQAGKTRAGFNLIDIDLDNLIFIDTKNIKNWQTLPDNFSEALGFCHFSASKDSTLDVLTNLCVEKDRILSSDDLRVTQKELDGEIKLNESLLIPKKIAVFLSKQDLREISINDSIIYYKDDDGVIFAHRVIADKFLDVSEFLNIEGEKITLPKELLKSLDKAQIMADKLDDYQKVSIQIKKDQIIVRGEGVKGWIEDEIDLVEESEKEFEFMTDPEHLKQILSKTQNVIANNDALMFNGDGFKHVVSLLEEEE